MLRPTVRTYEEFDAWFEAWKSRSREISRQKVRSAEIRGQTSHETPKPAKGSAKKEGLKDARARRLKRIKSLFLKDSSEKPAGDSNGKKEKLFPSNRRTSNTRLPHSPLFRKQKKPVDLKDVTCYNCNKKGHYASKCPEPRRERNQLMKAYLCGLEEAGYIEETEEHGPLGWEAAAQSLTASVQTSIKSFLSDLQAFTDEPSEVDQMEEVPEEVPDEGMLDEEVANENASQFPDDQSDYTYSGVGLSGATAALRSYKSALSLPETQTSLALRSEWSIEDLMDLPQSFWDDKFHELTSDWCDMVRPKMADLFKHQFQKELKCTMEEIQHLLMVALFLNWGTDRSIQECMQALTAIALPLWHEGRRIFRPWWRNVLQLASQWNFQSVTAEGACDYLKQVITLCTDEQPGQATQLAKANLWVRHIHGQSQNMLDLSEARKLW